MAEPDKTREPAINRENKSSAMHWAIGLVVVLGLGAAAWVISDHRGAPFELTPQHQPGAEDQSDLNQPPAVAPDADSNTGTLDTPPPATSGSGTQERCRLIFWPFDPLAGFGEVGAAGMKRGAAHAYRL